MNETKDKWIEMISDKLNEIFDEGVSLVFTADSTNNKYKINDNNYLICDCIFDTPKGFFIFEFLTNPNVRYRFSLKNKFFWEENLVTGKRVKRDTNWVGIFKISKTILDNINNMYNKFYLMAHHINFNGSGNGIYGVTPKSFSNLLETFK